MRPSMTANRSIWSWALYDFANTIFSAVVLTAYFPLYLTELAGANWYLGLATTLSMFLAGLVVPLLGTLSDHTGKTKHYLIIATCITVFFCLNLSFIRWIFVLMGIFISACFFYHASLVFYNSLLPVAAPPEIQGRVSGLGTGLGYLGVVMILPFAHWIDQTAGRPFVFAAAALLYLTFALPLFFFVPERKVENPASFRWAMWKTEWGKLLESLRQLPATPAVLLFLAGNFFVMDALNSGIFWLMVFAREVFHPGQGNLIAALMGINISAFVAGLLMGWITDRWGAMRTMILSSALLTLALFLIGASPHFALFLTVCITCVAPAIAGIWTSGRKTLIEFAPQEKLGEYFGLYGLTTKVSVIGSLLFSIVADLAGFRQALWILMFPAAFGTVCLMVSNLLRNKKL